MKSTDGGATWSAKQKINTDPQGHDQYYGWIDTAPNGHIWVGWHDRRSDPNNFQHIWYQADSTDEGATWNEVATADVASQPSTFIGDYAGMAAANTLALGMWWDSRIKSGGDPYTEPIPVSGCAVVVSPGTLPGGTVGVPYSQTVTASGGTAPYSFTITGTLPPGLSTTYLAPDRLQISGTPTTPGGYLFTVTATDSASCAGGTTYQVAITCGTITLAPATLPNGSIGFPYSQTITASGGTAPYTFAVTVGSLPPGLSLAAGGILSGTPTTLGSYPFTVTATDANSCTGSQAYTIVVTNCPPITLSPATLPPAYSGVPYSVTITASGGTAPYGWSITAGSIPPGMSMTPGPTTLVISGTPTVVGSFCFTVTATDVNACSGSQAYCIDVITLLVDYLVGEPLDINSGNRVRVFDNAGAPTATDFLAYAAGKWGTNVSSGDVDGLQFEEIQTGPGPGDVYGPQVRGWQRTGTAMGKINFYAYGTLKYGVNVGSANVDGDAYDEILSGAGPGAAFGPHVRGWNFDATTLTAIAKISYFAYGTLKYGVNVSGGSIDADSYSELLTAPGPGVIFGPQVRGWNYDAANVTAISKVNFNAFTTLQYGANVDGGDFDGDGYAEIDVSPGPGPTASFPTQFRGFNYDAATVSQLAGFDVTPWTTFYGGRVGAGDIGRDGADDLVCAPGPDPSAGPTVRAYTYTGSALTVIPPGVTAFPAGTGANATGANLGF
ncbi:MAG: putative Ig domain-containing protein [Acidobacteriota bacterium]